MSKTKKILLAVVGAIFFLLLLILCAVLWVASAVLDKSPTVAYQPHVPDMEVIGTALQKLSEGKNGEMDFTSMLNPNSVLEAVFDKREVNEIIASGIESYVNAGDDPGTREKLKNLSLLFTGEALVAEYSLDSGWRTPFGQYINFKCETVPEISNREIRIHVASVRAGSISVPPDKINSFIAEQIRSEKDNPETGEFLDAVKEVRIEDGHVRVKYSPAAMMKLIMKRSGASMLPGQ